MRDFPSLKQTMDKLGIHPILQDVVIGRLKGIWCDLAPVYNRNQITSIAGKVIAPLVGQHSAIEIRTVKAEIAAIIEAHYASLSRR
jgi:hypothetical protein